MEALLPLVIIVILIFAVPNIIDSVSKNNEEKREAAERRLEHEAIEKEFNALVQKYVNSELTLKILTHICNGNYVKNLPEVIIIEHNSIRSSLNDRSYNFDFKQQRIAPLHNDGICSWQVSANEAMARAINKLMGENYKVYNRDGTTYMELNAVYDF